MSVDSFNSSSGWNCASDALREIVSDPNELQTFVSGLFDRLSGLTEKMLVDELHRQRAERKTELDHLQGQIDRLTTVAVELAEKTAQPKNLV